MALELAPARLLELEYAGDYRMQSKRTGAPSELCGIISDPGGHLNFAAVNQFLEGQEWWDGCSKVNLRVITVSKRSGAFARDDDALYYARNFGLGGPDCDLLDVNKLRLLHNRRFPKLREILTDRVVAAVCQLHGSAVDEYMCHEAGHRLGYSIEEKMAQDFFRWRGRLIWPLIYMEEYRADVNSWHAAMSLLNSANAASVILYTLFHRLGLALENLREKRPGAGFIPYLHFSAFCEVGFLKVVVNNGCCPLLDFDPSPTNVLDAASSILRQLEKRVGIIDACRKAEDAAETLLQYAADRLSCVESAELFTSVLQSPPEERDSETRNLA
ncbi:hypothetical protein [Methylocystis hirsuta]|uniref:Uncharacterized protein n=1 Tax=Methylocystis hirsuta TaxID=369798 RepID=A0A3M9XK89_9HYPH|nr:hypothetical protein [Methylocystis hirsuta]RNJ48032.1 hypothetical protein D1O30_19500 [Methylocystis hirsuta]